MKTAWPVGFVAALLMAGCSGAAAPSAAPASSAPAKPVASASAKPAGSVAAKPSGQTKFTVGFSQITGNALPSWAAEDGGFYKRNGLDVDLQLMSGGTKTVAALLANQITVAEVGGSEVIGASVEGADLLIFATVSPVYPYKLEVQPSIKQPAELKGKKMGIATVGGSADIAGRVVMRKFGIDPDKDVATIVLGDSQTRYAALTAGSIDAAMADPPATLQLEEKGLHPLFDLAELKLPASQTVLAAHRSWVNANKAVVQAMIDAEVQATARVKKDRAFGESVLRTRLKLDDQKQLDYTYDFYAQSVAPSLPLPKPEQFKDSIEQLSVRNEKIKGFQIEKILDDSFVKNAADRGLDKS